MSPEVLSHAMKEYLRSLKSQVVVAEDFFFGRTAEGMTGLLSLPEDVRLKIDQLIWEASDGEMLDPSQKESRSLIAAAIMRSLEERMGIIDQ